MLNQDQQKLPEVYTLRITARWMEGAQPQELEEYRRFVINVAERAARAHGEGHRGEEPVSEAERAAIAEIEQALGGDAAT